MKRARKSNRVSWATGGNLCQVKLFLSEDYPSKVGQKLQDHLQAKTSAMLHSSINEPNDLPPGFESSHFLHQPKVEVSKTPQIKWECPLPFVVRSQWRVAAGEESREIENQMVREMRVLEAVYPRPSAIPPCPSVSLDVEEEDYDDGITPLIPIIPIEEEESMDILPESPVTLNPSPNVQPQNSQQYISAKTSISSASNASHAVSLDPCIIPLAGVFSAMEADLEVASKVVATIIKTNEQGTLIDMDLLVKIFTEPKILEDMINEHRAGATTASASSNTVDIPTSCVKPAIPSVPLSTSIPDVRASGTTPTSAVGSLPAGWKPANPTVSLLNPTPDKPATLSVPAITLVSLSSSTHDKPVTASFPFSRPVSGKPVTPDRPATLSAPAVPLVSLSSPTHDKPVTASFPFSRPVSGKPVTPDRPATLSAPTIPLVSLSSSTQDKLVTASSPFSRPVSGKPVTPDRPATLSATAIPLVSLSSSTHDKLVTASFPFSWPASGKPVIPDKLATLSAPAIPLVSLSSSTHDKPVTASVPFSRPVSGKLVTPSVSLLTHTPAPDMHRLVSTNFHHVSSGMLPALNTQSQQETALVSRPNRAKSMTSLSYSELSSAPLPSGATSMPPHLSYINFSCGPFPSAAGNLHAVVNQAQPPATTMPYKLSTGAAFAVKDANYYKNLIRQHGADNKDTQDSHIGIRHSNFQDTNPVPNFNQGEVNHKIQKPCIYFNGPRGCRNGFNCPFLHVSAPPQWGAGNFLGAQSPKRLKLGGEN